MNKEILENLKKWVIENYNQFSTGWTAMRSDGNSFDCFNDGYESGTSWAAYNIGCILGMDLEKPDEPEDEY